MSAVLSRIRRPILALALALTLTASASAGSFDSPLDLRDVEVTLYARRALMQDAELGNLNLGVSVHFNPASLWGQGPTRELADRALQIVENVKGVYQVKDDMRITGNDKERALRELARGLAGDGLDVELFSFLGAAGEQGGALPSMPVAIPGEKRPVEVTTAHPEPKAWEQPVQTPSVQLLPPIPVTLPASGNPGVLLQMPHEDPVVEPPSGSDLRSMVERIRTLDPRFSEVRAEVSDGRVTLSGRVNSTEDLIELGRMLSQLPGARHVDLRGVRTGR
jgi:hypothetical protein